MSWTPATAPEQAGPALAPIYARIVAASSRGAVGQLWRTLGGDPAALEALHAQYRVLVGAPAPLTPAQVEMIAIVVSATNGCGYCVAHHGPRLAARVGDALAREVAADYRQANLPARDRVLLDAAVAMTCEPSERTEADLERLREYGFDEATIVRATLVAGFYNQVNRIVLALGVELEPGLEPWRFGQQCG